NGGSLTLDNVAFELVLNDATGNDFSSLVEFEYDVLKGLTEDAALGYVESLNAGTIDVTIKGLVDGELVALNAGALSFSNDGGTVSIKGSASIPEPTTATLSLLALAALAARRRRK
ncbi:MAG: PEP-CTERM sorting domain-containing protein, partial [Akkermansia sp.]|nr:PEP-CTERM sorting domain-containing protein [Akkermansia sp.]